jgi:hypothetical protein
MTSFTNFESLFFAWRGRGDGRESRRGVRVGFRLCLPCPCKGHTFPGQKLRCVFFGCSVSWWAMLYFAAGGIVRHYVYSWGQINPHKTTQQIDRICGARDYCSVVSALSICVCEEHTFY